MNTPLKKITNSFAVIILLCCSLVGDLRATEVAGLYQATVEIDSQDPAARNAGFQEALKKVFRKVTGKSGEGFIGRLNSIVNAESLVLSFSYSDNPDFKFYQEAISDLQTDDELGQDAFPGAANPTRNVSGFSATNPTDLSSESQDNVSMLDSVLLDRDERSLEQIKNVQALLVDQSVFSLPKQYLLKVTFAEASVKRVLIQEQAPIWGAIRPLILAWVVVEEEGVRHLVGATEVERFLPRFHQVAKELGLPVFLPVGDLEDQMSVDANLLWGMFEDGLPRSPGRYKHDVSLIIALRPSESLDLDPNSKAETNNPKDMNDTSLSNRIFVEGWFEKLERFDVTWKVVAPDIKEFGDKAYGVASQATVDRLSETVLSNVSSYLSDAYSVSNEFVSENQRLVLEVSDVDSFSAFVKVQEVISRLAPVQSVALLNVRGSSLFFELSILESVSKLEQHIELTRRLKPVTLDLSLIGERTPDNSFLDVTKLHYQWQ